MENNNNQGNDGRGFRHSGQTFMILIIAAVITFFVYTLIRGAFVTGVTQEISYTEFVTMVDSDQVEKVEWGDSDITIIPKEGASIPSDSAGEYSPYLNQVDVRYYVVPVGADAQKLVDRMLEHGVVIYKKKPDNSGFIMEALISIVLPFVLIFVVMNMTMRRMGNGNGGIMGVGKSTAKMYMQKETGVTFKDVAGEDEAKESLIEIVDFLHNPTKYTAIGAKLPKGALLVGPPGTGKTLLAKAVAGEADVPFFSLAGSDFVEMFVGVGASRVRDLFRQAKEKAPCIIFIDEIDAIGRSRGKNPAFGGNDERENTLNQLLTEMDGFGTNSGVIILAATNRVEILDSALLRAGRFDRQIHVDLPELSERIAIFNVHLRPLKLADDLDVDFLARQTPGFSGADIANVCNEAALIAARRNRQAVCKQDFLDAVDRIIGGLEKKTKVMTQGEKRAISVHEAGHASVSWLLKYANPLVKVTIVPRGQSLGAAWYLPEERSITTKEQMLDEICATLAGRAAEEVFLGHVSSGALNDLERVTKRAYGMVAYLGMSDELSNLCYYNNQEYNFTKPYSDKTAETIDQEVKNLISTQYERAKKILQDNAEKHRQLAELLMEREVIFTEDVERIFGKRPWKSRADEIQEEEEKAMAESAEKAANEQATVSPAPSTVSSTQPVAVQSEEAEAPAAQDAQATEAQGEASSKASDEAPKA